MPSVKFKPNGKGDPRSGRDRKREALARLRANWEKDNPDEEWEPEKEPVISPILASVQGGIGAVIEALRFHDDEDAKAFVDCYDELGDTDRKLIPLEAVAFAAGIGSLRLAECAQTALFLHGQLRTKLLLASGIPAIVEKSIKIAKTTKGLADREWMLKAGGVLPVPKGAQIAIQNVYGDKEEKGLSAPAAWKSSEERLREFQTMTEAEPRRLPAPESKPMTLGGHVDHMQAETVEILRGDQ